MNVCVDMRAFLYANKNAKCCMVVFRLIFFRRLCVNFYYKVDMSVYLMSIH